MQNKVVFCKLRTHDIAMNMIPIVLQAGIENIRRASSLNDSPTFIQVSTFVCSFVCLCVFYLQCPQLALQCLDP